MKDELSKLLDKNVTIMGTDFVVIGKLVEGELIAKLRRSDDGYSVLIQNGTLGNVNFSSDKVKEIIINKDGGITRFRTAGIIELKENKNEDMATSN